MGQTSEISWTDATWNPAIGCTKISEECAMCYMMRDMGGRFKMEVNGTVTRTSPQTFNSPLKWQNKGIKSPDGRPLKVFTASLTDVFHPAIDPYRMEIWGIVEKCPDLQFQFLTKRPERFEESSIPLINNIWLGVSIGLNKHGKRVELLCETNAKIRFLSIEPLLGPVELDGFFRSYPDGIHWVIIGGESGNDTGKWRYRPCELEWYMEIIETCDRHGVPVFVKQLGTYLAKKWNLKDRHGRDIDEFPNPLKRREFPKSYQNG